MKALLTTLVMTCAIAAQTQAQKGSTEAAGKLETMALDSVVSEVNKALSLSSEDLRMNGLVISEAEVTLKTIRSTEGGGGFKLFVKASKKWGLEKASSITYSYERPETLMALTFDKGKADLHAALRKAIEEAATQWSRTTTEINGLDKDSFKVEISFGVTRSTSGGVEFEVWGVGVELDGAKERTASHSVTLTFKTAP